MSAEDRWGTDTVALGQRSKDEESDRAPRQRRVSRPRRTTPVVRVLLVSALALAVGVAGVTVLNRGAGPEPTPIQESANPAPREAKRPARSGLRKPREQRRAKHRTTKRNLAGHLHRPKKTRRVEQAPPTSPSPPPAPPAEAPAPAPRSPEAPPAPTPPSAEFGL